uniref:chlorhexidine efflux transporter n=1 Tax=Pseudomonas aeruginosa TaxID=287 RepID=UPI00273DFC34
MQGIKRKLVYVTAYELIGMSISTLGLALLAGSTPTTTGPLAVVITTVAVTWNFIYNCLFEFWVRIPRHSDTQPTLIRTPVP